MIRKGCMALSLQFHGSPEFFLSMPVDQLNEYAETASDLAKAIKEAVDRGKK